MTKPLLVQRYMILEVLVKQGCLKDWEIIHQVDLNRSRTLNGLNFLKMKGLVRVHKGGYFLTDAGLAIFRVTELLGGLVEV